MSERAMMSDRAGRAAGVARRYQAGRAMAEAMAEARRLLAETEPDSGGGRLYLTMHKRNGYPVGLWGWPAGRDALAESLAAFVGADDPGAYLATVAR